MAGVEGAPAGAAAAEPGLHDAARAGDVPALLRAIAGAPGGDLDARDRLGRTALMLAAWAGHAPAVQLLAASGARAGLGAGDDMNAAHFAAQKGHAAALKAVLDAGVSAGGRTRKGSTALHMAAQQGHLECVQLLLKKRADPRAEDSRQKTPLDVAKDDAVKAALSAALAVAPKGAGRPAAEGGEGGAGLEGAKLVVGPPKKGLRKKRAAAEEDEGGGGEDGGGAAIGPQIGPMIGPPARPTPAAAAIGPPERPPGPPPPADKRPKAAAPPLSFGGEAEEGEGEG